MFAIVAHFLGKAHTMDVSVGAIRAAIARLVGFALACRGLASPGQ